MGESFDPRLDAHDLSDTVDDRSLMITKETRRMKA